MVMFLRSINTLKNHLSAALLPFLGSYDSTPKLQGYRLAREWKLDITEQEGLAYTLYYDISFISLSRPLFLTVCHMLS